MYKKILPFFLDASQNSIIRQSFLFFSATMILNLTAFFYHFYMGRVLGPADYGILGTLLSLHYLTGVLLNVIQTSITKFTASYKAHGSYDILGYLLHRSFYRLSLYGFLAFLLFLLISIPLSPFLSLPFFYLFLLSLSLPFLFLLPLTRGVLQGLQRFSSLGINLIVEGVTKLLFGILLVYLGFRVSGAVLGIVLSFIVAFFFSLSPLHGIRSSKKVDLPRRSLYLYAFPVALTLLSLTAFYSLDIIFVKRFLSDVDAGLYVAAALLGKIVFFASLAIPLIMFPKSAELQALKKSGKPVLLKSLAFVSCISLAVLVSYLLFPRFVISLLFGGGEYYIISPYLWIFALAFWFYSLSYTLAMYFLSLRLLSYLYLLFFFNIFQVFALLFFHSSLFIVALVLLFTFFFLFLFLFLYTLKIWNSLLPKPL